MVVFMKVLYIQANISLRNSVIGAIESTMQDFVVPITERAIKVAVATTEQIVKKVLSDTIGDILHFFLLEQDFKNNYTI